MKNVEISISFIFSLLEQCGFNSYDGEPITQLEHALQCAFLALHNNATSYQVIAALLHDIGHLLPSRELDMQSVWGVVNHGERGSIVLRELGFPESVTEPVRLHVSAKQYLCSVESEYFESLSEASKQTLQLQGGIFSPEECITFKNEPFWEEAVQLRRWDELAKDTNISANIHPLEYYRSLLLYICRY
jgi:phosphonate degradation associated HDIG domain protein